MKILTLNPRKFIIFPPGMISLVFLPVLCYCFAFKPVFFSGQSHIEIYMWSPDLREKVPEKKQFFSPVKRDYLQINLNGNDADDKIRLDFARLETRTMLNTKDTIKGIDFHFFNKAKYWTYVAALDICETERAEIYIPYKDHVYVLYANPKLTKSNFICGNQYRGNTYISDSNPEEVPVLPEILTELKSFWAPTIMFLMMMFFTLKKNYAMLYYKT